MGSGPATYARDEDVAVTARALLDEAAAVIADVEDQQRHLLAKIIGLFPTSAWLASGATSVKNWLVAYTNLSHAEALRLEKIAELCHRHEDLADAVVGSDMPMKRAVVLARAVTPERAAYFGQILDTFLALNLNTSDDDAFTSAVRYWAGQVDQELRPRTLHPHSLSMSPSLFGGGEIHAQLCPSAFANVCTAIEAFTQDPDPADSPYRRSLRERQADGLDDLAAAATAGALDPDDPSDPATDAEAAEDEAIRASDVFDGTCTSDDLDEQLAAAARNEDVCDLELLRRRLRAMEEHSHRRARRQTRPRSGATINAVVDVRTLLGLREPDDLEGLVLRGDGWHLTRELLERLTCDSALLTTMFAGQNQVLDANPATEQFSRSQRRALAARDRCCVFPGCTRRPRHCDAHHLHHRQHGSPTVTANAALLCRFHHRLVHEYGWRLRVDDGHWLAVDRHGQTWTGRPAPPHLATAA